MGDEVKLLKKLGLGQSSCAKDRYKERHVPGPNFVAPTMSLDALEAEPDEPVNHETCAKIHAQDLPSAMDIYAGNERAKTSDSIAVELASWLGLNQEALFSMTSEKAVSSVVEQFAKILGRHGGQNGRRFRSGEGNDLRVMYLHLENGRICTLMSPELEFWRHEGQSVCEMGHPW